MIFRRRRGRADEGAAERRHEEEIRWARRAVQLAQRNNGIQLVGITVAVVGIVIAAYLAWPSPKGQPAWKAHVKLAEDFVDGVIPSEISKVGAPPAYVGGEISDHCKLWWNKWFPGNEAAPYPSDRLVQVAAPKGADVTITGATIHVFRSYAPRDFSFIECSRIGGPEPGTVLNVNLDKPDAPPTIVSDSGALKPLLAIPSAVIKISAGDAEYIRIVPAGGRRFYDWSISFTIVVDQQTTVVTFGSAQHPLRSWLGTFPATAYDYFEDSHTWRPAQ